jgi:transposase InsO family protein
VTTDRNDVAERRAALHLLRSGQAPRAVAAELGRSLAWVYKWRARFAREGWAGLQSRSRAPRHPARRIPDTVRQAIRQARSALEAEAEEPDTLHYVGARAIRGRLRQRQVTPLPSLSTIEREVRAAGMTRPPPPPPTEVAYPHLTPTRPHELVQVDVVPRHLTGGQRVSCFNALDVVSRYPTGQQYLTERASDAVAFLRHVWQTVGIPTYTQVDNEGCFSGGPTHPYVLGQVLRAALAVGTELVFSPVRHPQSQGAVERFHQDYQGHVWAKTDLADLAAVQRHSTAFFERYRTSTHHAALGGQSPAQRHLAGRFPKLPRDHQRSGRLPLTAGRVHFMRRVDAARQITLLNVRWAVPKAAPDQGVWATLEFARQGATLRVYDRAPDAPQRACLASHPFPLQEPVVPLAPPFRRQGATPRRTWWQAAARPLLQWLSTMF